MPTRHDDVDAIRYASELDISFGLIKERLDEYCQFALIGDAIRNAGVKSSDLASAISAFMAQLNKEYFEEDPVDEMSFDEAMGLIGRKYDV